MLRPEDTFAPDSDIDLLILFSGVIGPADERFLHAFMNPLWDLGLTLGHHVRDPTCYRVLRRAHR